MKAISMSSVTILYSSCYVFQFTSKVEMCKTLEWSMNYNCDMK